VHDPQIIGSSTVKAVVKLRFTSRAGRTIAVIRSMELIQKKTTQQFRQLDGVLKMNDPTTGERVSVPHKCTELDKQVPMTLGISRAILEHVLFCHQEDASWPLMEGAVLKKRFDDIFDSTKYSKALKMFRETEKEYLLKSKDLKVDCASLSSHLHAAQGFRQELEHQTEQVDILTEQKREIDSEVSEIDKRMEQLKAILTHIDDVTDQIEAQRAELDRETVAIERQKKMLELDMMKRGLGALKKQLHEFDDTVQAEVEKKAALENREQELETLIDHLRSEEGKLKTNEGKFQSEKERYEADLKARFKKMDQIAREHKLDLTQLTQSQGNASFAATLSQSMILDDDDDNSLANGSLVSISGDDMKGFYDSLASKKSDLERKLKEHQDRMQEEEDRVTSTLTDLGGRLQAIENGEF
jgi:DNA repair protein RAD50